MEREVYEGILLHARNAGIGNGPVRRHDPERQRSIRLGEPNPGENKTRGVRVGEVGLFKDRRGLVSTRLAPSTIKD
jgi:hypothetical protein